MSAAHCQPGQTPESVYWLSLRDEARGRLAPIECEPRVRELALGTWRRRMVNEYNSHHVFVGLADQMTAVGFEATWIEQVHAFAVEEQHHGVLCGAVVEALGGKARAGAWWPRPLPRHPEVPPLEGVLRNLLSICCLSETVAVALISAERLHLEPGPLRDVLSEILGDEVGHARLGWALLGRTLPELSEPARQRLCDYLRVALAHLQQHELANIGAGSQDPGSGRALGLCQGDESRALFHDTLHQVILPQLSELGLEA